MSHLTPLRNILSKAVNPLSLETVSPDQKTDHQTVLVITRPQTLLEQVLLTGLTGFGDG